MTFKELADTIAKSAPKHGSKFIAIDGEECREMAKILGKYGRKNGYLLMIRTRTCRSRI